MNKRLFLPVLALVFSGAAFSQTNTAQPIPVPSDGYLTSTDSSGGCSTGYIPLELGANNPTICGYSPSAYCVSGSFTLSGYGCYVQIPNGALVYLGNAGDLQAQSVSSNWIDEDTGAQAAPDVVSSTQQILTAANSSVSSGSSSASSSFSITSVIVKAASSAASSDIVQAILAAAGLMLSVILLAHAWRKASQVFSAHRERAAQRKYGAVWTADKGWMNKHAWKIQRQNIMGRQRRGVQGNYAVSGYRAKSRNNSSSRGSYRSGHQKNFNRNRRNR